MKNLLIIDGQGGRLGAQLTEAVRAAFSSVSITAVGTNAVATSAMLKAGADKGATGENAAVVACRRADIIIGPVGIVIADALMGEVTPRMACAVGQADAVRLLLPMHRCENLVVGSAGMSVSELISATVEELRGLL